MSFNNAISIDLLLLLARSEGAYHQLNLPLYIAEFNIKEEYLTDVPIAFDWVNQDGVTGGTLSHKDHPSFAALRDALEHRGYITTQRTWSNGDTVTEEFKLNGKYFGVGDRFPCAAAQRIVVECERRRKESEK